MLLRRVLPASLGLVLLAVAAPVLAQSAAQSTLAAAAPPAKVARQIFPAADAPPSGNGTPEIMRIEQDTKRLHDLLVDWADLAFYHEADQKLPPPTGNRIVFLGDSITHNWGKPQYSAFFADSHYVNRGISGQITGQMLVRFRQDVLNLHPKVLVILAGTNDIAVYKGPDLSGEIENNLSSIVELAEAHGIRVVLCSILPVSDVYKLQTDRRPPRTILALNHWIRGYAAAKHIPYVDYFSAVADAQGFFRAPLTIDGIHPSKAGFALMQPLVMQGIEQALREH